MDEGRGVPIIKEWDANLLFGQLFFKNCTKEKKIAPDLNLPIVPALTTV